MLRVLLGALLGYCFAKIDPALPSDGPSPEIEVGAQGDELRYWLAKEAVRQGERSLTFEASVLAATLAQATTMLSWLVTAVTAAVVVAINPSHPEWKIAAIAISAGLVIAAGRCIWVVFPRRSIQSEGFDAPQIMQSGLKSELEQLESLAEGIFTAVVHSRARIISFQRRLAVAWIIFAMTPLLALLLMEGYAHHWGFGNYHLG